MSTNPEDLTERLLHWFDRRKRDLPWRRSKDPYRVWLSEIMLQQTQVATVIPFYERFLQTWPSLSDLAGAADEQVMKAWEGLGYYSRARNLLAAARVVRDRSGGSFPTSEKEMLALPGIGEYTAAAIGSIAFGLPLAAVDGNIVRVFARITATAWDSSNPKQRKEVRLVAGKLLPPGRPGDFNEALMDLGATICLPRQPVCDVCPLLDLCAAHRQGKTADFPAKPLKKDRPAEEKIVLILIWNDRFHVGQRPDSGLLAGLYEFDWLDPLLLLAGESANNAVARLYPDANVRDLGSLTHEFSHKRWQLSAFSAHCAIKPDAPGGSWADREELQALPFPAALSTYRKKVLLL